jgi:hypothetical protein
VLDAWVAYLRHLVAITRLATKYPALRTLCPRLTVFAGGKEMRAGRPEMRRFRVDKKSTSPLNLRLPKNVFCG